MSKPHTAYASPQGEVVSLEELRQDTLERAGGKGANLGELIAAGLDVPPGFCVTTVAYRRSVVEAGLPEAIKEALRDVRTDDPASAEVASARITVLFEALLLPDDLGEAILAAYRALGAPAVAVRSSASTEGLPGASFAGQQATSLNVRGEEELLAAVRRCWASLWSARAIAYRERQGFSHLRSAIAVVIQRLVPAEVSGILFTANPVSGAWDEIVVNAAFGLGEAVVGGLTTPDSFTLDRKTLAVKERQTGRQEVETVLTERGTTERPLGQERAAPFTLSDAQLAQLGELGGNVERHFGIPQDIEWAYAGGRFWVLQARPITNLPPAPLKDVRWEPPFPDSAWWRRQMVENLPEPLSPLFDELYLRELLSRLLRWRVAARWYAVALLAAPLVFTAVLLALSSFSPAFLPVIFTTDDKASFLLLGTVPALMVGFFEELGWTGFAIPRLRLRYGVLATGLIVGVLWGAWHLLTNDFWIAGTYSGGLPLALFVTATGLSLLVGGLPAYRVLIVWVYDRTGGTLLLAMLMHASFSACTFILGPSATGVALLTYGFVLGAVLWVVVGAVAVANAGHLSRQPPPQRRAA